MKLYPGHGKIIGQAVLLIACFWFIQKFYPSLHPLPQTRFQIAKEDAVEKALQLMEGEIPAEQLDMTVDFIIEKDYSTMSSEAEQLAHSLNFQPFRYWDIAMISAKKRKMNLTLSSNNQNNNRNQDNWYKVTLSPDGKLLKLDFEQARLERLKDSLKVQQLDKNVPENSAGNARLRAYDFLQQLGEDTTSLTLSSEEVKQDSSGNIYSFLFSRTIPDQKIQQQIRLTGSGIILLYEYLFPKTEPAEKTSTSDIVTVILFISIFITLIILLVIYLIRFSSQESISFKFALPVAYTIGGITLLQTLFSKWHSPIVELLLEIFFPTAFLTLLMWLLYSICDAAARREWNEKLTVTDQLLHGKFFTAAAGRSVLRGLVLGTYALAIQVGLLYLYQDLLGGKIKSNEDLQFTFTVIFPVMVAALQIFSKAMFSEFFFRLFGVTVLKKWFRRNWRVLAVSSILAVTFPSQIEAADGIHKILLNLLPNFLFVLFLIRYEIITTLLGYFTFHLLSNAVIFSHTAESHFQEWGTGSYFILIFILITAALAVIIRRQESESHFRYIPDYIRKMEEKDRLLRELEIARTVQQKFLPATTPQLVNFQIAAFCQPAWEVGGDYFDYFPLEDGRLGIAIGDVSNKGVSAAFYMTMVKGFLKALAIQALEPARILSETNALFYANVERGNFISMIYGILDSRSGEFIFARAGHNPLLYLFGKSAEGQWLSPRGIGLGLLPDQKFRSTITQEKIQLQTGDMLVLYTDGYPEAMNEKSEQFGEENLQKFIKQHIHLPAEEIIRILETTIKKWEGNQTALDDRTMVVIKKSG
jgi:hypothetical protein